MYMYLYIYMYMYLCMYMYVYVYVYMHMYVDHSHRRAWARARESCGGWVVWRQRGSTSLYPPPPPHTPPLDFSAVQLPFAQYFVVASSRTRLRSGGHKRSVASAPRVQPPVQGEGGAWQGSNRGGAQGRPEGLVRSVASREGFKVCLPSIASLCCSFGLCMCRD